MTVWTDSAETQPACQEPEQASDCPTPLDQTRSLSAGESFHSRNEAQSSLPTAPLKPAAAPSPQIGPHGWAIPSSLALPPEEAREHILLPAFDEFLLERARVISNCYPLAEAEYRRNRQESDDSPMPHFERLFRIAADLASVRNVQESPDYDALLILTAWHSVRPGVEGFLGSFPKALLCPLCHTAPPAALDALSARERGLFQLRAPTYMRYLLCDKFRLRTCADVENADLRYLLKCTGFRLIRPSAVPEIAFPGITLGDDPPVRPWKLTLRQELSDDRAAELLVAAALWQIKYGLRLVSLGAPASSPREIGQSPDSAKAPHPFISRGEPAGAKTTELAGADAGAPRKGHAHWNIGAFTRTDWEDAFLSLGVRVPPSLLRESGLIDWRALLARCLDEIGRGNLPGEVLGKVSAWPQRVSHDSDQAIWEVLDRVARTVIEQASVAERQLFNQNGGLDYERARSFRGWARLFDDVSPQILSRFGVSAFTALHRVAPEYFGWGCGQLKPWELEQEHGKWKGPRGRALLRSAYAYALYECGLGSICPLEDQVLWQCTLGQFSEWYSRISEGGISPYELLYGIASRHGLTPLLNREITHTAVISLLAGVNLHQNLPRIEGCWEVCMRSALQHHGGKLEIRLVVPDLVPLPLRLRKATLAPLKYSYLHKELRLVRDFDLRMAREAHCSLEEIPGWWDDERIVGTPLLRRVTDPSDPARAVLARLDPDPWIEPRRIRFGALHQLISKRGASGAEPGEAGLSSEEMRSLLRLSLEATLRHSNVMHTSIPAVRRGFERLLARDDTREMLDSLLMHVGTAYETEVWGQVRKFIVLDVINDLLALTVKNSLLHLMSAE